jgi:anaerobic selenocysteine-containing dehydrogenase
MDCERIDRILAEHDKIDEAYLTHYAVNNPDGLKERDQRFREAHTYRTPAEKSMQDAADLVRGVAELMEYNARVARRQRQARRAQRHGTSEVH